ncbi:MAG TPA: acetyl-CoA carboxylase carboxyl transferase subunit beta, partial [Pseudonocardiaceae bacterium]|nr:acetyl-CoA carboxylase carboxyl transferase subunit beta [Pseudonocardiaceae bacterium]
ALRLDARSLLHLGVVDGVLPEPAGGSHTDPGAASEVLGQAIAVALRELLHRTPQELVELRRARFRRFGLARPDGA